MARARSINAVKDGNPLVIFPEGRLTVTGSLMKVYDGAGLIAEKSGAMVVPVHIDGAEATMFSRLTREQARRRWFPKFTLTVLEPIRLTVDDALKGKARRMAAGAALYQIMSDLVFRATNVDRTLFEARGRSRAHAWAVARRSRRPDRRQAQLSQAADRDARARRQDRARSAGRATRSD